MSATLPNPDALRDEAQRLATGAQAVSDSSEYPRLALSACREQAEALSGLADAIESHGAEIGRSRAGMTGEERREHRAAILRLRAARLRVKAADHFRASHDIGSRIPFGQPILVGHHSERGHRRAIERMHSNDARSYAASDYAETLEHRADSVERHGAIMASDSDAADQYRKKLAGLERERDQQKATNAAWRKFEKTHDPAPLYALGFTDDGIARMAATVAAAYSWEKAPFAKWSITNLGARIRDIKAKIERIEQDKAAPEQAIDGANGIRLEDCPADNRVRLFFPGKPDETTRSTLKRSGFRWTPSLGCWQAFRNYRAQETAKAFVSRESTGANQ